MGLRSSLILCAGGVVSNLVLVPLIWMIGSHLPDAACTRPDPDRENDGGADLPRLCAFRRRGAIATAGIFGILKSMRIVAASFGVALRAFRRGEAVSGERTDRDLPALVILVGWRSARWVSGCCWETCRRRQR